jgi:hypothetical protein
MAEPVLGIDAIIQFMKGDDYYPYACATDISISFEMETKSVKTIGDGNWDKPRGQKKGYTIDVNGLVKFDDDTVPHSFDLYNYFDGMTPVSYRIIFTNDQGDLKVIEGSALPVSVNLGGGSEGFATGSATLKGDGSVEVRDLIVPCPSSIISVQLVEGGDYPIIRITAHTGSPARYDYSIDGGGLVSQFANSSIQALSLDPGIAAGSHTLTIIPVCDNGYNGEEFNTTFDIVGTGGGCDVPTDIVFTLITENTATASWTPPGTPPGDGYYWELLVGTSFQDSGTVAVPTVDLVDLTGGLTYTFKVKSVCESGVSESGFISDTFETDAPANPTQIIWLFGEIGGAAGRLRIRVNGVTELDQEDPDEGVLMISGGDAIIVDVLEALPGADIKDLYIQDLTAGTVLYSNSSADPQEYIFTATADHVYELQSNVYNT